MKKLSLFSALGLFTFVATFIYAQDVYFDENYIVVPEDVATEENLPEEDIAVDEFDYGVDEDGITLETAEEEPVLAIEEEPTIEDATDLEAIPELDLSDFDGISSVSLVSSNNVNPLTRILAWWLWLFWAALVYLIFVYFALLPISSWEIYRRAGKKGWAFLVPFWWTMVYSEIAGMNKWIWLLPWLISIWWCFDGIIWNGLYSNVLTVLSIISLIWLVIANYRVARRYGWNIFSSILHAIIIFCPITVLVLGLGNYKYEWKKSEETVVEA